MDQYPKWLLALNFPNIILAFVTMTFLMFGGVHPFGNIDSMFWSFFVYLLTQLLWILPILSFFFSLFCWGFTRERLAVGTALVGWGINIISLLLIFAL